MRSLLLSLLAGVTVFAQTAVINGPGSGGTTVTSAPPYIVIGSTKYVAATGFQATLPNASPTWLNSTAPPTVTVATNGNILAGNSSSGTYFEVENATTSVESEFTCTTPATFAGNSYCGIFLYDSTNHFIYIFNSIESNSSGVRYLSISKWSWTGSGAATFSAGIGTDIGHGIGRSVLHYKISLSGTTLAFQFSEDGGLTFTTFQTVTGIGTVTKGGYGMGNTMFINLYSLVIQ